MLLYLGSVRQRKGHLVPPTPTPQGEVIYLRISADSKFKEWLNAFHDALAKGKKVGEFTNVEWCQLHLFSKAHDAIRSGVSPEIDIQASREYILDTYADEGVEHWRAVFDEAVEILEQFNAPLATP